MYQPVRNNQKQILPLEQQFNHLLQQLIEKDNILNELVQRIKNQEQQISQLLIEFDRSTTSALKISFNLYRNFIHQEQNQKYLILQIIQNGKRNQPIWLSKNLQIVNVQSLSEIIDQEQRTKIVQTQVQTSTINNFAEVQATVMFSSQAIQTQLEISEQKENQKENNMFKMGLTTEVNRLKDQLGKYESIIQSLKQLKEIQKLWKQQQFNQTINETIAQLKNTIKDLTQKNKSLEEKIESLKNNQQNLQQLHLHKSEKQIINQKESNPPEAQDSSNNQPQRINNQNITRIDFSQLAMVEQSGKQSTKLKLGNKKKGKHYYLNY